MNIFYYLIILGGFYLILIVVLLSFWQLVRRLKIAHKAKHIVNVFSVLIGFLLVNGTIKPHWYELFNSIQLINDLGEIVFDKNGDGLGEKVLKVKEHLDTSMQIIPILILAYLINSLLSYFLWYGALIDEEGEPMVPKLLRQLSAGLLYLIALTFVIAIIFPNFLTNFLASVGASGAVAAFLGQQPVKQAFTALSLNVNKPIRKGDFIEIDGYTGTVQEIGWKNIKLTTSEHNLLTLPNVILVNSIYINYTRLVERYVDIEVMVSSSVSPKRVKDLLIRCALDSQYVWEEPFITLSEIRDFRAKYFIRVLTDHPYDADVRSEILSSVWYMLRRENIHPDSKENKIENPIEKAKELLDSIEILAPFNKEDDEIIAQKAEWLRYGPPERVVIQGERDASLYIIAEGNLKVTLRQEDGSELEVATLGKNTIFGEMALLTGEPRKATVRAMDDVLLCKISKETIRPILYKRPEILEELSSKLAEKQMENERKSAQYSQEQEARKKENVTTRLLDLMKNFFREEECKNKVEEI